MDFNKYLKPKYIITFSSLNYLGSGISLLVSLLIARQLGREEFGYFSYGMIFANTLNVLMQFGTDKTLVRDLVQLKQPDLTISSATWLWFFVGAIFEAGIIIWIFFISSLGNKSALVVLICSMLGFMRGMSPAGWFDYKGKANYQSLIVVIDRIIFLISTIAIIFFFANENAIIAISLAQLGARIVTFILEWKYVSHTAALIKKPVYSFIKKLIGVNTWVWFGGIGNLLMTQANQLILNGKFGPKELALYGFSFQIIMIIRLLQQQILRLLTPSIALITENIRENAGIVKKKLFNFCLLNISLSLAILLPTYFLVPYIISHFINKDFLSALGVLNVLYIWIVLFGAAIIINQFLIGLKRQKLFFTSTTIFGLLSLLLAFLFIGKYGATGAALSLLISHLCSVIFQLWVVLRKINQEANARIIV